MSTKNLSNDLQNNTKSPISNSETTITEYSDISIRKYKKSLTLFFSPIVSYFNVNHAYLYRKYYENNDIIDLDKSHNFIPKDSFFHEQKQFYLNSDDEENEYNDLEEGEECNNINNNSININNNYIYNKLNNEKDKQLQNNYFLINKEYIPSNHISNSINNMNNINLKDNKNQIFKFNDINTINYINKNQKENSCKEESINIQNFNEKENKNKEYKKKIYKDFYGSKGWNCPYCNNYNFQSRIKCNRCKKPKNMNINKNINKNNNINEGKEKTNLYDKEGDWVCFYCKNVNFAFRKICNRCHLSKIESENLFKINFSIFNNYFQIFGNN